MQNSTQKAGGKTVKIKINGHEVEGTAEEIYSLIQMTAKEEKQEKAEEAKPAAVKKTQAKKAPAKKETKKKETTKKEIDVGKAGALRKAGWSLQKIADEMGVSPQTIANKLKAGEQNE